jgi:Tfp pilus assembly PilM family ATPase/Tfp pilus assembly protein PilN
MMTAEIINTIKSRAAKITEQSARLGRFVWGILSLSLADKRIAPGECLSVALSTRGISVVYASRFLSRLTIRGIRRYSFETETLPTPQNVASAVVLAINELKAAQAQVILVIPKTLIIVKTSEFPVTVKDNLSAVISYELDRLTPLAADRAFYDFQVIGEDKGRLKIILAALNTDILQPYLAALQEREVCISRVTVSSSAFGTIGHYMHRQGSTIFIVIEKGGYEVGLVRDGQWQMSETGNFLSGEDQSQALMIAKQINPLVEIIKKNKENPAIIISNHPSLQWCSKLRDVISSPVRFIREIDDGLKYLNKVNPKEVSSMALGGALECLWPGATGMNLLNKGIHKSSRTPAMLSIILLAIVAFLGLFWMLFPLQVAERKIASIDREIAARKNEVKKVEALMKDVENLEKELSTISTFKTSRPMVLILLKEITRILPNNTWLSRVRVAESFIEIEGYAASATELLPKLEASEYFEKVDFVSPTFRDTRMNADRFTIKMEMEGLAKGRTGHGKQK